MKQKIKCPCCNEFLLVSVNEDKIVLTCELETQSNVETSEVLKKLNIEFG